jgi:hypothetical protein
METRAWVVDALRGNSYRIEVITGSGTGTVRADLELGVPGAPVRLGERVEFVTPHCDLTVDRYADRRRAVESVERSQALNLVCQHRHTPRCEFHRAEHLRPGR